MSPGETYWGVVGFSAALLLLLALREYVLLRRLPHGHRERGEGWFTAMLLCLASATVIGVGFFIDNSRRGLENILPAYPSARYAFEESDVFHGASWVYKTKDSSLRVANFYRTYAEENKLQFFEDRSDYTRMSFVLPEGTLFLTIKEIDGTTILYFTRDGQVRIVTR